MSFLFCLLNCFALFQRLTWKLYLSVYFLKDGVKSGTLISHSTVSLRRLVLACWKQKCKKLDKKVGKKNAALDPHDEVAMLAAEQGEESVFTIKSTLKITEEGKLVYRKFQRLSESSAEKAKEEAGSEIAPEKKQSQDKDVKKGKGIFSFFRKLIGGKQKKAHKEDANGSTSYKQELPEEGVINGAREMTAGDSSSKKEETTSSKNTNSFFMRISKYSVLSNSLIGEEDDIVGGKFDRVGRIFVTFKYKSLTLTSVPGDDYFEKQVLEVYERDLKMWKKKAKSHFENSLMIHSKRTMKWVNVLKAVMISWQLEPTVVIDMYGPCMHSLLCTLRDDSKTTDSKIVRNVAVSKSNTNVALEALLQTFDVYAHWNGANSMQVSALVTQY